jgi:acetyl-CoA carboxylase carboxyl transferase subunit alpha
MAVPIRRGYKQGGAAAVAPAREDGDGLFAVSEFLVSMLESVYTHPRNGRNGHMQSASKAQFELERIEKQIEQLEAVAGQNQEARRKLQQLHDRVNALRQQIHAQLSAWEKTELARHPQRPYMLDYVERIFSDWSELHGDRRFADDPAIVAGMARFHGDEALVLGTQKGRDTKQKVFRNFGMPNPEGYRKALRLMQFAEKFGRPIFTFVDVPGANPGLGAEERGQAEAIAYNLREMARLEVPIITAITGEGGSGGALAIAVADRVLMLENSIYSVISPEGCASIMWRDSSKKEIAAQAMRITARDMTELGCVDDVVPEPEGGAHNDYDGAASLLDAALQKHYTELKSRTTTELVASRYNKFRHIAQFFST